MKPANMLTKTVVTMTLLSCTIAMTSSIAKAADVKGPYYGWGGEEKKQAPESGAPVKGSYYGWGGAEKDQASKSGNGDAERSGKVEGKDIGDKDYRELDKQNQNIDLSKASAGSRETGSKSNEIINNERPVYAPNGSGSATDKGVINERPMYAPEERKGKK